MSSLHGALASREMLRDCMMLAHHQPKICGELLCSLRFLIPTHAFQSRLRVSMDHGEVNASRTELAMMDEKVWRIS